MSAVKSELAFAKLCWYEWRWEFDRPLHALRESCSHQTDHVGERGFSSWSEQSQKLYANW